ncbi:glycosyltransferase [Thermoflexus sp.]|uniref:glycosyltransferase n=1 Tax=Thermoflexus sp. TaxID=1969742 RepID=UPI002ADD7AFB|nr:glycosyltransferase [Thermoflexus sp.]
MDRSLSVLKRSLSPGMACGDNEVGPSCPLYGLAAQEGRLKRILLITSSYPLSPEETFNAGALARELALGLQNRGWAVWVVTPRKDRPIRDPHVPVLEFPWWGSYRELASQSTHLLNLIRFASLLLVGMVFVERVVSSLRVDLSLALWAIPSGALACWAWRRKKIPYGVWALGSDIWGRHRYPLGERIVRRVLKDASFCLADGCRLAEEVGRLRGKSCGFLPASRRLPLATPPASLPPARCHLLYVGRFEKQKGIDLLIEALRSLRPELEGVRVHLLGDGTLRPWVEEHLRLYALKDHVSLYGYASPQQVVAMMKAVHYLVIPSRIESIPLVFGDAMQVGLPVIATDVGDLGMLVRRGQVGWVVEEASAEALATGLREVLKRPEEWARLRARTVALRRWFQPETMLEIISNLIEGNFNADEISKGILV